MDTTCSICKECSEEKCSSIIEVNKTGLMFAAKKAHSVCMKGLLLSGANINAEDNDGLTALIICSAVGNKECLEILLQNGADLTRRSKECGMNALMEASHAGHTECVKLLLEYGAIPSERDKFGGTSLHFACGEGHLEVAKILVASGADINDNNGGSPLMDAARNGHLDCLKFLISNNAIVNDKCTNDRRTALMIAADGGHISCMTELLVNGATKSLEDTSNNGKTALTYAEEENQFEAVALLKSFYACK